MDEATLQAEWKQKTIHETVSVGRQPVTSCILRGPNLGHRTICKYGSSQWSLEVGIHPHVERRVCTIRWPGHFGAAQVKQISVPVVFKYICKF